MGHSGRQFSSRSAKQWRLGDGKKSGSALSKDVTIEVLFHITSYILAGGAGCRREQPCTLIAFV